MALLSDEKLTCPNRGPAPSTFERANKSGLRSWVINKAHKLNQYFVYSASTLQLSRQNFVNVAKKISLLFPPMSRDLHYSHKWGKFKGGHKFPVKGPVRTSIFHRYGMQKQSWRKINAHETGNPSWLAEVWHLKVSILRHDDCPLLARFGIPRKTRRGPRQKLKLCVS